MSILFDKNDKLHILNIVVRHLPPWDELAAALRPCAHSDHVLIFRTGSGDINDIGLVGERCTAPIRCHIGPNSLLPVQPSMQQRIDMLLQLERVNPPLTTPLLAPLLKELRVELQHAVTRRPAPRSILTTSEFDALLEELSSDPNISPTPPASPGYCGVWVHIFEDEHEFPTVLTANGHVDGDAISFTLRQPRVWNQFHLDIEDLASELRLERYDHLSRTWTEHTQPHIPISIAPEQELVYRKLGVTSVTCAGYYARVAARHIALAEFVGIGHHPSGSGSKSGFVLPTGSPPSPPNPTGPMVRHGDGPWIPVKRSIRGRKPAPIIPNLADVEIQRPESHTLIDHDDIAIQPALDLALQPMDIADVDAGHTAPNHALGSVDDPMGAGDIDDVPASSSTSTLVQGPVEVAGSDDVHASHGVDQGACGTASDPIDVAGSDNAGINSVKGAQGTAANPIEILSDDDELGIQESPIVICSDSDSEV